MNQFNFFTAVIAGFLLAAFSVHADTYTVTNTKDTGAGSLRQAILDAEAHAGEDIIEFNIPAMDPGYNAASKTWTIVTESYLPNLDKGGTVINATTQHRNQPAAAKASGPVIELSGEKQYQMNFGLVITGANNLIRGFIINRYTFAITLAGKDARANEVSGNYIGTDASGTTALPNTLGIWIYDGARKNVVGGADSAYRNLISGNSQGGLLIDGVGTDSNRVMGNYIGTDVTGAKALGNEYNGIVIQKAHHTIIGGAQTGMGNLLSGTRSSINIYTGTGITLEYARHTTVAGNIIGADKTGKVAIPNASYGICIARSDSNIIGGASFAAQNVISGNTWQGILMRFPSSFDNLITGNCIGATKDRSAPLSNGSDGIGLEYGARNTDIGPGNLIAWNGGDGVCIKFDSTFGHTIYSNAIFKNTGNGISLISGANNGIAAPVITSATATTVTGLAKPNQRIQIFSDAEDEGASYEGAVTTDGTGKFTWTGNTSLANITALAFDDAGNTSEFSKAVAADVAERPAAAPKAILLTACYPNPFNAQTRLEYTVPVPCRVQGVLFDISGRKVMRLFDEMQPAGLHRYALEGGALPSGVYFVHLQAGSWEAMQKITLVR